MLAMAKKKPVEWTAATISSLRERLGLTVDRASERVGVSPRQWTHWEAGTRKPSGPAAMLLDLLSRNKI